VAVARLFLSPYSGGTPAGIEVEGGLAALRRLLGAFATQELELSRPL
jgi:hypothetical protein